MADRIEDWLAKNFEALQLNTLVMAKFYQAMQQQAGEKISDTFDGRTLLLNSGEWEQIGNGRAYRDEMRIYNWGPCSIGLCPKKRNGVTDIEEWTTYFKSPTSSNTTATIPFLVLPAGDNIPIKSRSAMFAISLQDSGTSTYSIVSLVEPLFAVKPSNAAPAGLGMDYVQNNGRLPHEPGRVL